MIVNGVWWVGDDHLMAGGKTSGNSWLRLVKVAWTMMPSMALRLGIFLSA